MVVGADVTAALEEHVLEEVSEAGAARRLVLGPDVVPEIDCHEGQPPVLVKDDPQPVVQPVLLEGQLWDGQTNHPASLPGRAGF